MSFVTNMHVGRSFTGNRLESECPCTKEACGLVNPDTADQNCPEHGEKAFKTMRQIHSVESCPGRI